MVNCEDIYVNNAYLDVSRVAQWKRAGPITQRSVDRNHALLYFKNFIFAMYLTLYDRLSLLAEKPILDHLYTWIRGVVVITSA